jgi:hypothetical protein
MISWIVGILLLYLVLCIGVYFSQEKFIFYPKKLPAGYRFSLISDPEEITFQTEDGIRLHGILSKVDASRGLVFFLHGRGSTVADCTPQMKLYNEFGYDFFVFDYRGFGKSEGNIRSLEQFFNDVRSIYAHLKNRYEEKNMVIAGNSLGTAPAAKIASEHNPGLLILECGYYDPVASARKRAPLMPLSILLKYKFRNFEYVSSTKVPIAIFHGLKDEAVPYTNALLLQQHLKPGDKVILLEGEGHGDFTGNAIYQKELKGILG